MISKAMGEEALAALWSISAILCFGFGYDVAGWIVGLMAAYDFGCAAKCAHAEALKDRAKR